MTRSEAKITRVVGLQYDPADVAPKVVLQSVGPTAEAVIREGRLQESALPIVKNEEILDQLFRAPIDAPIDPELYELVAILLVHVFSVDDAVAQCN